MAIAENYLMAARYFEAIETLERAFRESATLASYTLRNNGIYLALSAILLNDFVRLEHRVVPIIKIVRDLYNWNRLN